MYKLFLDDRRSPINTYQYTKNSIYLDIDWVVVRNYDEFVQIILKRGIPDVISFDHDLADAHYEHQTNIDYNVGEKTGFHCALWFLNYLLDKNIKLTTKIYIHSMNIEGGKNIESLFNSFLKVENM